MAHQYPDQFIRHAFNATDGQVQIRYGKGSSDRLKPDGYVFDEEKKEIKILEYMGCYFHGKQIGGMFALINDGQTRPAI